MTDSTALYCLHYVGSGELLMASPIPLQLNAYWGTLILDNGALEAFLGQHDSVGNPIQTLMMFDTSPSGGYDRAHVTAAYQFFSSKPNAQNRPNITVHGFYAYAPGTNVALLHVVRA
jgi:hypothetical protein